MPGGKIIKSPAGNRNNMAADKFTALPRACFTVFQAAFPFQHRPTVKIVLRQLAENTVEINVPIAGRTKASRSVRPVLIAAIDAAAPTEQEFSILDMERLDTWVIAIDKPQIVHMLQMQVAGIVENITARMVTYQRQKTFERNAVMQIFSRMDFIAHIHAVLVETIQYRVPALRQFIERFS